MGFLKKKSATKPLHELSQGGTKPASPVPSDRSATPASAKVEDSRQDEGSAANAAARVSDDARDTIDSAGVRDPAPACAASAKTKRSGHVRKNSNSPMELGVKKAPGSDKKKTTTRARARTLSSDLKSRGRSQTSKKSGANGKAKRSSLSKSKEQVVEEGLAKLEKKSAAREVKKKKATTPKAANGKKARSKSARKGAPKSKSPLRSRKTKETSTRSSLRRKLAELDADEASLSSRSSFDSDMSSFYSDTETDVEDATFDTMRTDFESIEYDTTEDTEGADLSGASGSMSSFESTASGEGTMATFETRDTSGTKLSKGSKDSLAKEAIRELNSSSKESGSKAETASKVGKGGKRVASASYLEFTKRMEGFVAKGAESQLVVQVTEHGNVEKLELLELAHVPKPTKPDQVVVKVESSTITLQDCMIRRGKWYEMQPLPFIPGSDLVGTIFAMGDVAKKNSTFQVGDKVAAAVPCGGNAKYATLPYQSIVRVPSDTDSDVALCLISTYVPAREALDRTRKLHTPLTGANILVIGGNGPSGLAAIELALLEGAKVFTTADERHHDHLTKMGAKCFPIDPNKWLPSLRGKMDAVLDSVCLDGFESSSLALNPAGTLVCTGMSAVYTQGQIKAFGMSDVRDYKAMYCKMRARYLLNNTLYYDKMERYATAPTEYAQHFRYLCHLASKDSIKPLVSSRSPLNLVPSIQKAIEHGDTAYGVCVCTPWTTPVEETTPEPATADTAN